ncbi:hypothetical protein EGW08_011847 [Elysia chlorotica]|uniref:Uncharacterized protein n=1 Tax=Elysia chlorotica TaxID=188477 RepID=A0A3S0ZQF7_ELYCH|nr:hypothetical protein EGW08_011847 [Elysia chlorotica]
MLKDPLPPISLTKPPKSKAQLMKENYERRKADPEKYRAYLDCQKRRAKDRRDALKAGATEEEKAQQREKTRERVAKWRQKQKEEGGKVPGKAKNGDKPVTRKQQEAIEKRRQQDRDRKRLERQGWSRQKKKAESMKAMARRKAKSSKTDQPVIQTDQPVEPKMRSKAARKQALYRLEQVLPLNPAARQETLKDLIRKHRHALLNVSVKQLLQQCKGGRQIIRNVAQHLTSPKRADRASTRRLLSISRQHLFSLKKAKSFTSKKLRKSDSSRATCTVIQEFLTENSTFLSEKKTRQCPKFSGRAQ